MAFPKPKVVIKAHTETGAMFTPVDGFPNLLGTRLEQVGTPVRTPGGIFSVLKLVAFVTFTKAFIEGFFSTLVDGDDFPLPGKLQRQESNMAFYKGHKPAIIPASEGREEETLMRNGLPVYHNTVFVDATYTNGIENPVDPILWVDTTEYAMKELAESMATTGFGE